MEDKIVILRATTLEICILQSSVKFDLATQSITTFDRTKVTRERLISIGTEKEWVDDLFDLFISISKLNLTSEAIGILCCLSIFSPDHGYPKHLQKRKISVKRLNSVN